MKEFQGDYLDTGADRTVIGAPPTCAYSASRGKDKHIKVAKTPQVFRFGGGLQKTAGTIGICIP